MSFWTIVWQKCKQNTCIFMTYNWYFPVHKTQIWQSQTDVFYIYACALKVDLPIEKILCTCLKNMQKKSPCSIYIYYLISEADLFESGARATPGDPSWSTLSTHTTTITTTSNCQTFGSPVTTQTTRVDQCPIITVGQKTGKVDKISMCTSGDLQKLAQEYFA